MTPTRNVGQRDEENVVEGKQNDLQALLQAYANEHETWQHIADTYEEKTPYLGRCECLE